MSEEIKEEAPQADSEQVADAGDAEAAAMKSSDETAENAESGADDREMHKTICSECGKECEVPFKPEEGKPVYCKECYMAKKPRRNFGGRGGGFNRGGGGRGNFNRGPREMHDAVCSECKKDCQVPFKPSGDKPVLCGDCYKKSKGF